MKKLFIVAFLSSTLIIASCTHNGKREIPGTSLKTWNDYKWNHIVRQDFDYSCGAAALATLTVEYFEDHLTEPFILKMIIDRLSLEEVEDRRAHGFSMADLVQVAKDLGYEAGGVQLAREAVFHLDGPIIVILRDKKYNIEHFAVLKGVDEERAYLADSYRGNISIPLYTFFKQWNGLAVVLGKEGFGLPTEHSLSVSNTNKCCPARDSIRQMNPALGDRSY